MIDGRLGRATSRLLTNEQNILKEKELAKKLGKIPPEESVKIPQIGEWSLSLSKTATTSTKQLPSPL
ncbi:dynein light chain binding [Trichomonas vaginalis G3]|nr:dynein light chain binding [Trichomonas vaginalis G3]KAI5538409.1 dynein light chain binding [Trichomonas vaginalis G3]